MTNPDHPNSHADRNDEDAYLAEIAAAMLLAIAEAKARADTGDIGAEFRELLRHAIERYEFVLEELAKLPGAGEFALGVAKSYGAKIEAMLALAVDPEGHPATP